MCRLFGFRSVINSQVHQSLVGAENALMQQSLAHPDGWGVAYYLLNTPHLIKSVDSALGDELFQKVSGIVSSQTVLAHLRKATHGKLTTINTHPFQFGSWVFAHNGNIKDFTHIREALLNEIEPPLRRFILGDTDSEVIFYLILNAIHKCENLASDSISLEILQSCVSEAIKTVCRFVGPYSEVDEAGELETYLTFILTNGNLMLAFQGGKSLYYSTYKKKCGERDTCSSFAVECEAPTESGQVNHLIFSSEPLQGENIWISMKPGQLIGVDSRMNLSNFDLK